MCIPHGIKYANGLGHFQVKEKEVGSHKVYHAFLCQLALYVRLDLRAVFTICDCEEILFMVNACFKLHVAILQACRAKHAAKRDAPIFSGD